MIPSLHPYSCHGRSVPHTADLSPASVRVLGRESLPRFSRFAAGANQQQQIHKGFRTPTRGDPGQERHSRVPFSTLHLEIPIPLFSSTSFHDGVDLFCPSPPPFEIGFLSPPWRTGERWRDPTDTRTPPPRAERITKALHSFVSLLWLRGIHQLKPHVVQSMSADNSVSRR